MIAPVFLDTAGLIAVWDKSDPWHPLAAPVYDALLLQKRIVVTSLYVLLECGNAAAKKPYRQAVTDLFNDLDEGGLVIVPTPKEHHEAWNAYTRSFNAAAGLVDQYSFVIMRSIGITEAFTNDRHFKSAGFTTLY